MTPKSSESAADDSATVRLTEDQAAITGANEQVIDRLFGFAAQPLECRSSWQTPRWRCRGVSEDPNAKPSCNSVLKVKAACRGGTVGFDAHSILRSGNREVGEPGSSLEDYKRGPVQSMR